jgi:hypothetical protein
MEVGDSFFVPAKQAKSAVRSANNFRSLTGVKFCYRTAFDKTGGRIWRVA